jgi:hypothetical protein
MDQRDQLVGAGPPRSTAPTADGAAASFPVREEQSHRSPSARRSECLSGSIVGHAAQSARLRCRPTRQEDRWFRLPGEAGSAAVPGRRDSSWSPNSCMPVFLVCELRCGRLERAGRARRIRDRDGRHREQDSRPTPARRCIRAASCARPRAPARGAAAMPWSMPNRPSLRSSRPRSDAGILRRAQADTPLAAPTPVCSRPRPLRSGHLLIQAGRWRQVEASRGGRSVGRRLGWSVWPERLRIWNSKARVRS